MLLRQQKCQVACLIGSCWHAYCMPRAGTCMVCWKSPMINMPVWHFSLRCRFSWRADLLPGSASRWPNATEFGNCAVTGRCIARSAFLRLLSFALCGGKSCLRLFGSFVLMLERESFVFKGFYASNFDMLSMTGNGCRVVKFAVVKIKI